MTDHLLLFKLAPPPDMNRGVFGMLLERPEPVVPGPEQDVLWFVGEATSPEQMRVMIAAEPMAKYVLFKGRMAEVKVQMPIMIDGRNMDSEWF